MSIGGLSDPKILIVINYTGSYCNQTHVYPILNEGDASGLLEGNE